MPRNVDEPGDLLAALSEVMDGWAGTHSVAASSTLVLALRDGKRFAVEVRALTAEPTPATEYATRER